MYIVGWYIRQVKIHDLWKLVDINTTCGNIRGNKQRDFSIFKVGQCFSALILAFITMNGSGLNAVFFEHPNQFIGTVLSATEHQCLLPVLGTGQMAQ